MEHNLNRHVILNEDSEFKSLYTWSLHELDEEGAKVSGDLIPWYWSLYFTATELTYTDRLTNEPDYDSGDQQPKFVTRNARRIRAKLRPGVPHDWHGIRQTSYSMFGTDRTITDFALAIELLADSEAQERSQVWGSASYTSELDFKYETTEDAITVSLFLRPETFERYVNAIKASRVDQAVLELRNVQGFYSAWSPGISTKFIKVLTEYEKEHPIEMPDDSKVTPPRLGTVGEWSLSFVRKLTLENRTPEPAHSIDLQGEEELAKVPSNKAALAAQHSARENVRAVALLKSVRTAAWVIAALLALNLIT